MINMSLICKGKILLSLLMPSVMYLHFSMQEEEIREYTNAKCHVFTF